MTKTISFNEEATRRADAAEFKRGLRSGHYPLRTAKPAPTPQQQAFIDALVNPAGGNLCTRARDN